MDKDPNVLLLSILKANADHHQRIYETVRASVMSAPSLAQQDNRPLGARSVEDVPDSAA